MPIPPLVATGQIISAAQMNAVRAELIAIRADMPLMADGSVGAPGLRFALDTDTGIYRSADNSMTFAAGGAARLTISTTGVNFHGQTLTGITSLTTSGGIALQPLGNLRVGAPGAYATASALAVNVEFTDQWRYLHDNQSGGFFGQDYESDGLALWLAPKNTGGAGSPAPIVPKFFFGSDGALTTTGPFEAMPTGNGFTGGRLRQHSTSLAPGASVALETLTVGTNGILILHAQASAAAAIVCIRAGYNSVVKLSDPANVILLSDSGVGYAVLADGDATYTLKNRQAYTDTLTVTFIGFG